MRGKNQGRCIAAPTLFDFYALRKTLVHGWLFAVEEASDAILFAGCQKLFPGILVGGEILFPGRHVVLFADDLQRPVLLCAGRSVNIDEYRDAVIFELARKLGMFDLLFLRHVSLLHLWAH